MSAKHIFQRAVSESINAFIKSITMEKLHQVLKECYDPLNEQVQISFERMGLIVDSNLEKQSICPKFKEQSPIRIAAYSEVSDIIDSFPPFLNKTVVKNHLTQNNGRDHILIAELDTEKITVNKEYNKEQVLQWYVNKQHSDLIDGVRTPRFKKFVHKHIDFEKIVKFVVDMIGQLPCEIDMKASISQCLVELKKEIGDFNKDLQQISQELSYRFVSDLHDLCLHLLWKWHEERVWEKREEVLGHV